MILSKKIRCLPTAEQEILFKRFSGAARFAFNLMLSENIKSFDLGEGYITGYDFSKLLTKLKQQPEYSWLKDISSKVPKQGCFDCDIAFKRFFNKTSKFPKFKKKGVCDSFYVNYQTFVKTHNGFRGERLGNVRTAEPLPKAEKYYNPRVKHDGKYWYITFGVDVVEKNVENTGTTLGVDLGIKTFVTVSNGSVFANINKTKKTKSLYKKICLFQRKLSRCKKNGKNRQKILKKLKLMYRHLKYIRHNYIHQITTKLVKTKPAKVVVECLNVLGMLKNKFLSRVVAQAGFYTFVRQLEYKCRLWGIELLKADMFFPSSKLCSKCGCKKDKLKLSERIYRCEHCGNVMDRDLNAAINLSYL